MPKINFVGAILISLVLVAGALWFRFVRIPPYSANLASVQLVEGASPEDLLTEDYTNEEVYLPGTTTAPLTKTELFGRQLFSDFIALKSQNQATSENLTALANNYAESLANYEVVIQKVDSSKIAILPNTEENLAAYGKAMSALRTKYKNLVITEQSKTGDITNLEGASFTTFINTVGKLYRGYADELVTLVVPTSLVENHVSLVNNYLENAEVVKLINGDSQDPTQKYAALNIYAQNTREESELFINIQKTMQANGISLDNSI